MFCSVLKCSACGMWAGLCRHPRKFAANLPARFCGCRPKPRCRARLCAHWQRAALRLCPFSFSLPTVLRAALRQYQGTAAKCVSALGRLRAAALARWGAAPPPGPPGGATRSLTRRGGGVQRSNVSVPATVAPVQTIGSRAGRKTSVLPFTPLLILCGFPRPVKGEMHC